MRSAEEKKPSSSELTFCAGVLVGARDHELQNFRVAREMVDKVVVWLLDMVEEEDNEKGKSA